MPIITKTSIITRLIHTIVCNFEASSFLNRRARWGVPGLLIYASVLHAPPMSPALPAAEPMGCYYARRSGATGEAGVSQEAIFGIIFTSICLYLTLCCVRVTTVHKTLTALQGQHTSSRILN